MIKRSLQVLVLLALMPLAMSSFAQLDRYVAGTHYTELPNPVNTQDSSKVEVLEAFWYGCSHCFRFEPLISDYEANAPEYVDFVRFPAMWNGLMKVHGQAFYTAEALDALHVMHEPIFNAINLQGNRLANENQLADLFAEHGIDRDEFSAAFNSFSVRTKVNQAESRMEDYQIRSTPNMVVNGKYLITTGENVRTQQELMDVVQFLVEKEWAMMQSSGD